MERHRNLGPQPIPCWAKQLAPVDQFSFSCHRYPGHGCPNDLFVSPLNCQGNISYSLPLERYPPVLTSQDPFKNKCSPMNKQYRAGMIQDLQDKRLSTFYYFY